MRTFKRGRIDANKDAKTRDLSEAEMMFMGIGGKEITDLELLKREDQDLLSRQMMCHHQQNSLGGSGPRDRGRPLTPERSNSPFRTSKSSHGDGDAGDNVMKMS